VAFGISFPAVFFLLSVAGAVQVETAFELAKWSGLGLIGLRVLPASPARDCRRPSSKPPQSRWSGAS
jgi:hypothetical protein